MDNESRLQRTISSFELEPNERLVLNAAPWRAAAIVRMGEWRRSARFALAATCSHERQRMVNPEPQVLHVGSDGAKPSPRGHGDRYSVFEIRSSDLAGYV